jgi:hypothetical protein
MIPVVRPSGSIKCSSPTTPAPDPAPASTPRLRPAPPRRSWAPAARQVELARLMYRSLRRDGRDAVLIDGQDLAPTSAGQPSCGGRHRAAGHRAPFHDTIRYNIGYGRPGAPGRAGRPRGARRATRRFHRVAARWLGTPRVGERGLKPSGGEKQRVAMALDAAEESADPDPLDEATSAPGFTQRAQAIQAARRTPQAAGRTTLVIAHRAPRSSTPTRSSCWPTGRWRNAERIRSCLALGGLDAGLARGRQQADQAPPARAGCPADGGDRLIDLLCWPTPNWSEKISIALEELGTALPSPAGRSSVGVEQFEPTFLASSPRRPPSRQSSITRRPMARAPVPGVRERRDPGPISPARPAVDGPPTRVVGSRRAAVARCGQMGGLGPTLGQHGHFLLYAPEIPTRSIEYARENPPPVRRARCAARSYRRACRRRGIHDRETCAIFPWIVTHSVRG